METESARENGGPVPENVSGNQEETGKPLRRELEQGDRSGRCTEGTDGTDGGALGSADGAE